MHTAFLFRSLDWRIFVLAMRYVVLPINAISISFDSHGVMKRFDVCFSGINLQLKFPFSPTSSMMATLLSPRTKQASLGLTETVSLSLACFDFAPYRSCLSASRFATCVSGSWLVLTIFLMVCMKFSNGKAEISFKEQLKCATSSWMCFNACTL